MFHNKTLIISTVLTILLLITACGGGSNHTDPTPTTQEPTTAEDVKNNYVTMAYAAYTDSLTTAQTLQATIDAFIANPTENNLQAAKDAYKAARIPYQQSEIMRWDTAITLDQNLDADGGPASVDEWEGQVNAWPLDENHIMNLIAGSETITSQFLMQQNGADNNEANVTTGVHAIEFMLWGQDTHGVTAGAGERPVSDFANDGSCADNLCARRAQYLKMATNLLVTDLTAMQAEWSPTATNTQGTLAYNFLHSELALDYILSSVKAMATDELASARMSSGLILGDPEEEHDCFSDLSHIAIYYNFQGVKNALYGHYAGVSGASMMDLIKQKDQTTFVDLDAALNSIETKMKQILDAAERQTDPVKFDQIIGQDSGGAERQIAEAAVNELIALDVELYAVKELLSLTELNPGGGGDGD